MVCPGFAGAEAHPTIERVEPNPITPGNEGEYVVLSVPAPMNLSGWTLTDGRYNATLPATTVEGEVALSGAPRATELLTDLPVHGWRGYLPLSAEGDELSLLAPDDSVVDRVTFGSVEETASFVRGGSDELTPRAHGPRLPALPNRSPDRATAFVLPDAPEAVIETLRTAGDRLWLAGYEFTDPTIADILLARHRSGVDVRVLVDGRPVSGQGPAERAVLDRLSNRGIPVTVLQGARRRFAFHHPKYAIVDDTALVMSENWKAAGVGGSASRGWAIAVEGASLADDLATVYATDAHWRSGLHWDVHRGDGARVQPNRSTPLPIDRHDPRTVDVEQARIVTAPDHAEGTLLEIIENAERRIEIQQVRIGDVDFPLLEATRAAAERGVAVRIHLDHSWYVAEDNAALVEELSGLVADYDVEITMHEAPDRFGKIHNKGMIVDREIVVLGSMNWNNASMRDNREVLVVLRGEDVAAYYGAVLERDRTDRTGATPIGYLGIVAGMCATAGLLGSRRLTFAD